MDRILVVAVKELDGVCRSRIELAARRNEFRACFFDSVEEALPHLQEAEVVFGQSVTLARNAPRLRWLCTPSAGVEQFTVPGTFLSPDAVLTNSSGAYGVTIAEHVVMVTLEILRRQPEYDRITAQRLWHRSLPVRSIKGSRVLLLGTGDIGQETAKRFRAFEPASLVGYNRSGMNPGRLFDRIAGANSLAPEIKTADIIIISLPNTVDTFHLLDADRLSMLHDGALIVNVGRGSVIDENALVEELRNGRLFAALDVFEQEPLPPDSPLWTCPSLMITPHISGNMTLEYTKDRIVSLFLEDFDNYCSGRRLKRLVDLKKGY
ncbi:MAG: D-2-hydroxyacid dehydrogenase [Clostridiales bacterium]|nr:D-2-hydroxyacid dehydrogenase [Clostridiales bacterium]